MKKVNLLSRAEMRKVMGGNPVIIGCEVTCYFGGYINDPSLDPTPYGLCHARVISMDCSIDQQQAACPLGQPVPNTCGNCTIDNDQW